MYFSAEIHAEAQPASSAFFSSRFCGRSDFICGFQRSEQSSLSAWMQSSMRLDQSDAYGMKLQHSSYCAAAFRLVADRFRSAHSGKSRTRVVHRQMNALSLHRLMCCIPYRFWQIGSVCSRDYCSEPLNFPRTGRGRSRERNLMNAHSLSTG
jgi:hypothetical protein